MSNVPSSSIYAIVLAAGSSQRMGDVNKLLADFDGKPMVARVVETACAAVAGKVIVVTGYEAEKVRRVLGGYDVQFVHNNDFAEGLSTSLRAGIALVSGEVLGAFVFLGDMPLVNVADVEKIRSLFCGGGDICLPVHGGKHGNPVLWGRDYFGDMSEVSGDKGARGLLTEHRKNVIEVEAGDGVLRDFDTLDALAGVASS